MNRYRRNWSKLFLTSAANVVLLVGGSTLVHRGYLTPRWSIGGVGLGALAIFAVWTALFIWLVANPFGTGVRMVLSEPIHRIDYIFLIGMAVATISYYGLVYFLIVRFDPKGLELTGASPSPADLLYVSTLTFLSAGLDIMTPVNWWPRLTMLAETLMGLGYLAGILALLTNRLASEPSVPSGAPTGSEVPGPNLTEGAAWAGGSAAGATIGSIAGPVGTAVGAVVGGVIADKAVDAHDPPPEQRG